ncbi:hypothetical protein RI543_000399 [Arxiozyma heterogenica]|uniref:ATPase expression protein 1 n=1 Tax=Arxiozyma heterogenica TaxID=278026 RepID=A0AAN7WT00_9SACH|nr:hypothetical protein RI543_000399 [Kazachstania heterogenica]
MVPVLRSCHSFSKLINTRFYTTSNLKNGLAHPFFKLSPMEQFSLCFSERKTSLANGSKIFPIFTEDLSNMKQTLQLNSINLSNKKEVIKWLQKYDKEVNVESSKSKLKNFGTNKDGTMPTSFINKEKYPQLNEIIELFKNETLITKDPVTLNSLIDYFLLNNQSGIFAENIYIFLLNEYSDSIDKLNLILGSLKLHLNNKLDYFPDIENIILKILISINKLSNYPKIEFFDNEFHNLLKNISIKFNFQDTLSPFNDAVIHQMLQYHLFKTQNLIECKFLIGLLLSSRHIRPSNELLHCYLNLLNKKTQTLSFKDSKLQKLIYLSDFRILIEQYPTIELIRFILPLCGSFNELRNILNIIMKQDNSLQYFETLTDLIIKQYEVVCQWDKSIMGSVEIIHLYNCFNVIYKGQIPVDPLNKILILMGSNGNYSMIAYILNQNKGLQKDSGILKEIINEFPPNDSLEKKKFTKLFKLSSTIK